MVRSYSVRQKCPVRATYFRPVLPLVVGFPHRRVLGVIRLPRGMQRAFPVTVLLRLPGFPRASGASQVLRRLSSCMPWPEDSGGPAPPRPNGCARVAFGSVNSLGVRHKPCRSCTSTSGCAVTPTAYRMLCRRFVHLVRRAYDRDSAMDARLDTGGWLTLTRQGLSPCQRRQAFLARERRASGAAGSRSAADAGGRRLDALVRLGASRGLRLGAPIDCNTIFVPPDVRSATPHRSHTTAYWITSSAWNRSVAGIVRPSAWAVLRLMASTNFMGRSTGRSAGCAPWKILATNVAARRARSSRSSP
jgi:hypothetical protein